MKRRYACAVSIQVKRMIMNEMLRIASVFPSEIFAMVLRDEEKVIKKMMKR